MKPVKESVKAFLEILKDEKRKKDSYELIELIVK